MSIKSMLKNFPQIYRLAQGFYPYYTLIMGAIYGRRGWQEHVKSTWSMLRKDVIIKGRPINITIEPTNMCNLACPVCETGAGILGRVDGHMSLEEFKTIMDKVGATTNTLMFYFMGEAFLNKKAYDMIRYAKDIGIPHVMTCTNGDAINPQKLFDCGLDEISFQIGGMTQKTHEIYRINSNLERVLSKLKETVGLKKINNSNMHIQCGFIVMKHNEHEVEQFKELMAVLGVDEASIVEPCVRDIQQGHMFLTKNEKYWIYDKEAFNRGILKPNILPNNKCDWIHYSLSIHVNGDVVPCCRDTTGKHVMGNLFTQDLDEVWNGERFVEFRRRIHDDQGSIDICRLCSGYPVSKVL